MTTYTVSYYIKNATKFEEGATVVDMKNGWFRVIKAIDVIPSVDPLEHTKTLVFPIDSELHNVEILTYVPPKVKRKAAWKQNPLNRYSARSRA
jgi:hypothetical protein